MKNIQQNVVPVINSDNFTILYLQRQHPLTLTFDDIVGIVAATKYILKLKNY